MVGCPAADGRDAAPPSPSHSSNASAQFVEAEWEKLLPPQATHHTAGCCSLVLLLLLARGYNVNGMERNSGDSPGVRSFG